MKWKEESIEIRFKDCGVLEAQQKQRKGSLGFYYSLSCSSSGRLNGIALKEKEDEREEKRTPELTLREADPAGPINGRWIRRNFTPLSHLLMDLCIVTKIQRRVVESTQLQSCFVNDNPS